MARYKAEQKLFINDPVTKIGRLVRPGEVFESNDAPGKHWAGVDDAGKKAVAARATPVGSTREAAIRAESEKRAETKQSTKDEREKESQAKLKGRNKDGSRSPDAARAKDRPPTPGLSVAEQQTRGEEPTRD